MSKSTKSKKNQESSTRKVDPTIIVAIIGLLGTIIAALLASPFLTTFTSKTDVPASNTSAAPPTALELDSKSIINLDLENTPCEARLLPTFINPEDTANATVAIRAAIDSGEWLSWPAVTENNYLLFSVTSSIDNQETVIVNDTFMVDVALQEYLPGTVNVLDASVCGGTAEILLPPLALVGLSNQINRYNQQADYTDADLFRFESGQSRSFGLPVQCKSSGIYRLNIDVSFEYSNISNVTNSNEPLSIACPEAYILWRYDVFSHQFFGDSESYEWNGEKYEKKP